MPIPAVRVRPATREDIPSIVAVAGSSLTDEEQAGFGTPRSEQTFVSEGRLAAAWRDPNFVRGEEVLVGELDGRIVACVTLEDRGEALELVNLDVDRDHQRRGVGTQVVRSVEARARREGRRAVTLGTSRNAEGVPWRSLPWWLSLGYRATHEEENAWTRSIGPGAREIRMRRDLSAETSLELRDVEASDLPIFFAQQQDPRAVQMAAFTAKDPADPEAFQAHWTRIMGDPSVRMRTIVCGGRVAGSVGSYVDPQLGRREVTYWIGREFWGRGVATEALGVFLARQNERPVYARAATDNAASIRVLEKCGFTRAGTERGFANARGREIEEAVFVLRSIG